MARKTGKERLERSPLISRPSISPSSKSRHVDQPLRKSISRTRHDCQRLCSPSSPCKNANKGEMNRRDSPVSRHSRRTSNSPLSKNIYVNEPHRRQYQDYDNPNRPREVIPRRRRKSCSITPPKSRNLRETSQNSRNSPFRKNDRETQRRQAIDVPDLNPHQRNSSPPVRQRPDVFTPQKASTRRQDDHPGRRRDRSPLSHANKASPKPTKPLWNRSRGASPVSEAKDVLSSTIHVIRNRSPSPSLPKKSSHQNRSPFSPPRRHSPRRRHHDHRSPVTAR